MTTEEPTAPTPPAAPSAAAAPTPPAAPTAPAARTAPPSVAPARIVAGLGAIATLVSIFLNWADVTGPGGHAILKGTDVPFEFLWDKSTSSNDPSLVLPLLVAAVLIGLGVLLPTAKLAGIIGGGIAIAVAVLYGVQVQRGLDAHPLGGLGLFDFISVGVYVAFVGGLVALIGAAIPSRT